MSTRDVINQTDGSVFALTSMDAESNDRIYGTAGPAFDLETIADGHEVTIDFDWISAGT